MGKKAKCMADGGIIGSDGMTDAQRAKRNAALQSIGMSTATAAQAVPQPVERPVPQPMPQPQGAASGILGILGNRGKQIDKAAGYAAGGIVRGKGGVDRVPMAIGGVYVNLTGGKKPEAVLPGKTVEALGGPDAVEALIESTNGKPPVRDGLKAGGRYASGLVINEDDPRLKPFGPTAPTLGSGLSGMGRQMTSSGVPPPATFTDGRDATGTITADSAQSMAAAPMARSGGISGSIDMAGVNGVLARENEARGEMIDSMVRANGGNGIGILGDVAPGRTQNDLDNAEKTRRWMAEDMMRKGGRDAMPAAVQLMGFGTAERGQDLQERNAQMANETARYGHDTTAARAAGHDQVLMRGQDISGANEAIRAGVDRERLGIAQADSRRSDQRFGIEKGILEGNAADQKAVRDARAALTAALASGDPKAIETAKANATAAGIKFDRPNNEFTSVTDNMGTNVTRTNKDTGAVDIINTRTGAVRSIAAPGAQQVAQAPASAIDYLKKNPAQSAAFKAKYGYLPEGF